MAAVRSVTIMRIRDGAVFVEESQAPNAEECFKLARGLKGELEELDRKRKDEGSFDKPDGVLHYEIDTESIAHIVYTSKEYQARSARAMLKELIKRFELAVPEPDDADAGKVKASFSSGVKDVMKKYAVPPSLADEPVKPSESVKNVGSKVEQAREKLAMQLQQAAENEQDLRIIEDRSKRAHLIASEIDYDSASLKESAESRNKKIILIAAAVGVGLLLVILIIVLA